jgi:hypothetical protein
MLTESQYELTGNKKAVVIAPRDFAMLEFLWRHRAATFRTLHMMFYGKIKMQTCYTRLDKLRRQGFVTTRGEDGDRKRYWCLEKRGMAYLARNMGALKTLGFKPQSLYHDHLASSILLGDWFMGLPGTVAIITEQDLISRDLPEVAPGFQDGTDRRPDGLWRFQVGPKMKFVALEVELHAKPDQAYAEIIRYYDNNFGVEKVIWVVAGKKLMQRIHTLTLAHATLKKLDHLFILADDIKKDLWQAGFKNESLKGVTLAAFLNSFVTKSKDPLTIALTNTPTNYCQTPSNLLAPSVLFNFDGFRVKSSSYSKYSRLRKT